MASEKLLPNSQLDPGTVQVLLARQAQVCDEETATLKLVLESELSEQNYIRERIRQTEERLIHQRALIARLKEAWMAAEVLESLIPEVARRHVQELDAAARQKRQGLTETLNHLQEEVEQAESAFYQWLLRADELVKTVNRGLPAPEPVREFPRVLPFPSSRAVSPPPEQVASQPAVHLAGPPEQVASQPAEDRRDGSALDPAILRFLTGKVVGRDLRDFTGRLLAETGAPVTLVLAEQADRAGVLWELVTHLTWPEEVTD